MKDQCYNFGIIGGAGYALALLNWLEPFIADGRVRLHAAAVLPHEQGGEQIQRAKARGTQLYASWEEMLEATRGQLDLCLIPTSIALHLPMATRALELGHRVFLEKPLAGCFEDALAVVRCAQEHGERLAVGFQDLYQPSTEHIHELIWGGSLGALRSIRLYGLWPRGQSYYDRNGWAGRVRVADGWVQDSPLNNAMAHFLNLALYWAGEQTQEVARFSRIDAELYRARPIESFDTASIRITTLGGALVEFHSTHSCRENIGPLITVECEHGRIEWGGSAYTVHTGSGAAERFALEDGGQLRVNMFSELIEWIAGRPSRRCTGIQGLGQSLCVTVLHKEGVIHTVAPEFIDSVSVPEVPVIEGIEGVFRECAQAGGLPSEHGAAWSKPAVTMHVPEAMIRELDSAVAAAAVR